MDTQIKPEVELTLYSILSDGLRKLVNCHADSLSLHLNNGRAICTVELDGKTSLLTETTPATMVDCLTYLFNHSVESDPVLRLDRTQSGFVHIRQFEKDGGERFEICQPVYSPAQEVDLERRHKLRMQTHPCIELNSFRLDLQLSNTWLQRRDRAG